MATTKKGKNERTKQRKAEKEGKEGDKECEGGKEEGNTLYSENYI